MSELKVDTPEGAKVLRVAPDDAATLLSDYLRTHGVPLNTRCGGRGLCESCTVEDVAAPPSCAARPVKACEVPVNSVSAHIRVPGRSYLKYRPHIVTDFRVNIPCGQDPLYVPQADETALGVAIDIGTTTVALVLADLRTGKVLGHGASFNQQMNLGDDVVTRIDLCTRDKSMIGKLQRAVASDTILPLLRAALAHARATGDDVKCVAVAANTTMLHLLAGEDPTPMGVSPFTPVFLDHRQLSARQVLDGPHAPAQADPAGGPCHAGAALHLLPSAAAYVGADLTAGVVASGMLYDDGPSLLVDVGTNGEIILKHKGAFLGCATAAGPAFEGAGLSCGMRAGDGTIAYVKMTGQAETFDVATEAIGDAAAPVVGMCGSAYIDLLAEGRRVGLLGPAGRFEAGFDARGRIIAWEMHHDKAFRLAFGPGKRPIAVSQVDIANLLQAKAAIAAGILTLLAAAGLEPADIKTLYLAGGFGTKMSAANAIAIGLLPGFAPGQIQPVGNTALAGAYLALLDGSLLREMTRVGQQMRVIELNLDPRFEDTFIEQLMLP